MVEVGERVAKVDRVQAGMTFVDGLGIGDVGGEVLRDRRKLAGDGVVVVVVDGGLADRRARERPRHREPGLRPRGDLGGHPRGGARARRRRDRRRRAEAHVTDPSALQQDIRRVLKRYFNEVTQRKPVILPVIMEV